jgi:CRP/FNR family cyclic AMP-dependent transcriptional regulator
METGNFGELDDIDFLREAKLFQNMPESVIRTIVLQAKTMSLSAGEWVVRRGEPGTSLFVVKSGVVEVLSPSEEESRPLAYLGRGDCLGELAVLTDSPRNADVRVPEHAELLIIEKELFQDLMQNHTGFGSQLCVILANRLIKLLQDLPTDSGTKELQGSLRYFDLATVIQTLITSGQSGRMALNTSGQTVGELVFQHGNIFKAKFGHRTGDEAIHQLFQVELDAEFLFTSTDPPHEGSADPDITFPAMALLMDSVRFQDELQALRERLPPFSTVLERAEHNLEWSGEESRKAAVELWEHLKTPASIDEILEASSSCRYHAAQIVHRLLESEQAMPALE